MKILQYPFAAAAFAACCLLATTGLAGENASEHANEHAAKKMAKTEVAHAKLMNPQGQQVGEVDLDQTPHGLIAHVHITNLPEGAHAFHIHAIGKCEAPDFKSAGGHFNPRGREHGFMNPKGPHAGDLPNIFVPASGKLDLDVFVRDVRLDGSKNGLFDADGSAIVVHAGPDDYKSDPAGDAGPRIACGVVVE
jgi:Cu-Zn family superoxide dismutase